MKLTRRQFLRSTAAALAVQPAVAGNPDAQRTLGAREVDVQLLPDGYEKTSVWAYDGLSPGPEIRVPQGAKLVRKLNNFLRQPTSVHWHGIRLDNAMDGVSGLTQEAVAQGQSFEYSFVAPDAGTFWYHAHNNSPEQVGRGLYGPLIVEEPTKIEIDREEVLVLDDWLVDPETAQIAPNFAAGHDMSHAGRIGNYITTNGEYQLGLDVRQNDRLRLRLINASNARVFALGLDGLKGWTAALDGMPLVSPMLVTGPIILGPAQRVDLIVDVVGDVASSAHIFQVDRGQTFLQVAFAIREAGQALRKTPPEPLPVNPVQIADLRGTTTIALKMEGGAMGGLGSATLDGVEMSMRDVAAQGKFWAFNGAADGFDGPPLAEVKLGEHIRLSITNDTAFSHAMHLHGMHFSEIGLEGSIGATRDTTMIARGETKDIAFVADNPGQWLFHCHMLSHAASGMMTRIDVS